MMRRVYAGESQPQLEELQQVIQPQDHTFVHKIMAEIRTDHHHRRQLHEIKHS